MEDNSRLQPRLPRWLIVSGAGVVAGALFTLLAVMKYSEADLAEDGMLKFVVAGLPLYCLFSVLLACKSYRNRPEVARVLICLAWAALGVCLLLCLI